MKTFSKTAAQGDVMLVRIDALPCGLHEIAPTDGTIIVTHSETGHHHVIVLDREDAEKPNARIYGGDNPLLVWVEVNRPTALEHRRSFDMHAPVVIQPGFYEVRRQREYIFEGFRRVQD